MLLRRGWDRVRRDGRLHARGSGPSELVLTPPRLHHVSRRDTTGSVRIGLELSNQIFGLAKLRRGATQRESGDAGSGNEVKAAVRAEIGIDDVRCLLRRKTRERNRFREQR